VSTRPEQNKANPKLRIQPPLLLVIHVVLAFGLAWFIPLPLTVPPFLEAAGFGLAILGFLLGAGALIAFRRARQKPNSRDLDSGLVTSGIYGYSRNPVYLGFVLLLIGLLLDSGTYWGMLLAPMLVILLNQLVIQPEEEYLARKFGEQFDRYRAKVRRWI
jgi:protein-S-isoprenylcysteine O-methyltransferase Ste14